MLVIALAPLTTIAEAMHTCPSSWNGVEIVNVGGSRFQPSQTPVTEYNHWQNPEAAAHVLKNAALNGATIQLVLADAFNQLKIVPSDLRQIQRRGNDAIKKLLPALEMYMGSLSAGGEAAALADAAGVIYALDNRLGSAQLGLVHPLAVSPPTWEEVPEDVRGQTIIGFTDPDRISMLSTSEEINQIALKAFDPTLDPPFDVNAAIGEILSRQADNADVVTDIDARRMHHIFLQGVRGRNVSTTGEDEGELNQMGDYENHMFVPLVSD
jgi:inosine-uridine nucleoside N-ribohydrolase